MNTTRLKSILGTFAFGRDTSARRRAPDFREIVCIVRLEWYLIERAKVKTEIPWHWHPLISQE